MVNNMKNNKVIWENEKGFILITAMLMLVVLSFVGFMAIRNTTTEMHISTNERRITESFYEADGGSEVGDELIEQSIACINGFGIDPYRKDPSRTTSGNSATVLPWWTDTAFSGYVLDGNVNVVDSGDGNKRLWVNEHGHWTSAAGAGAVYPSDINRDFYLPANYSDGAPRTNVVVEGATTLGSGAAITMLMGYHGKGKGLAAGGSALEYLVSSKHEGLNNSQAKVCVGWRHVIGQEGDCIY